MGPLFSTARRRRLLRRCLDEATRRLTEAWHSPLPPSCPGILPTLRRPLELAIILQDGRVIAGKSVSTRPFMDAMYKVHDIKTAAKLLGQGVKESNNNDNNNNNVHGAVHIRGDMTMMSCFEVGSHTLAVFAEFMTSSPEAMDVLTSRINRTLGFQSSKAVNADSPGSSSKPASTILEELSSLVESI